MAPQEKKTVRRTNSDLWFYSLSIANVFVFLLSAVIVFFRTKTSEVKVPIRLIAGNEVVQGRWWNSYLLLLITLGLLVMAFVYSARLRKLDPLYRNGVLILGICFQILAFAVLFRVAGLSSLI
ncbi:MAG: hypothetical protein H6799_01315 [Candidatus Nomurabacteria bacterium]|nr:MAG: hypothetical protein H6799_01315 [Candidatus Nomurabacteria bacterium]HRV75929.1 hypothetical protein [Candidatus Saccharimonadales bacterium]